MCPRTRSDPWFTHRRGFRRTRGHGRRWHEDRCPSGLGVVGPGVSLFTLLLWPLHYLTTTRTAIDPPYGVHGYTCGTVLAPEVDNSAQLRDVDAYLLRVTPAAVAGKPTLMSLCTASVNREKRAALVALIPVGATLILIGLLAAHTWVAYRRGADARLGFGSNTAVLLVTGGLSFLSLAALFLASL